MSAPVPSAPPESTPPAFIIPDPASPLRCHRTRRLASLRLATLRRAALILVVVLLAACSSTVSIRTTEEAELSFEAGLIGPARSFLVDVLSALRAQGQGMFDLPRIAAVAAERGAVLRGLAEPEPGSLSFSAEFTDAAALAEVLASTSFSVRQAAGSEVLTLRLQRSLADDLLALLPEAERGAMELFLPEDGSTREEYIDYLQWLLEGYGDTEELLAIFEQTNLVLLLEGSPAWRVRSSAGDVQAVQPTAGGVQVTVPVFPLLLGEWLITLELQRP